MSVCAICLYALTIRDTHQSIATSFGSVGPACAVLLSSIDERTCRTSSRSGWPGWAALRIVEITVDKYVRIIFLAVPVKCLQIHIQLAAKWYVNPASLRGYSNVVSNPGQFNDAFYKDVFLYETLSQPHYQPRCSGSFYQAPSLQTYQVYKRPCLSGPR